MRRVVLFEISAEEVLHHDVAENNATHFCELDSEVVQTSENRL